MPSVTGAADSDLAGVACTAATNCVAVGYSVNKFGVSSTLVERLTGTAWSVMTSPSAVAGDSNQFTAVACPTSSSCTAVGYATNGSGGQRAMAEQWSGHSWAADSVPLPTGAAGDSLEGVACAGASSCEGVGIVVDGSALALSWDGRSWQLQKTVTLPGEASMLFSVARTGSTGYMAVGRRFSDEGTAALLALAERYVS